MSIYSNYKQSDFELWIFNMDDKLDSFISSLYGDIKKQLDFSLESLTAAEKWLLEKYTAAGDLEKMHRAITVDGFVRYTGEVFRKNTGAYWDMDTETEGEAAAGPFLVIATPEKEKLYPYKELKAVLTDKTGEHLLNKLLDIVYKIRTSEP